MVISVTDGESSQLSWLGGSRLQGGFGLIYGPLGISDVFEIVGAGMAARSRPVCPEDAEQEPRLTRFRLESEQLVVMSFPIAQASTVAHLTEAEREVAQAILQGLSNEEIAQRRGTSPRTVANQIAGLFRKIGARSRCELARRLLDRSTN